MIDTCMIDPDPTSYVLTERQRDLMYLFQWWGRDWARPMDLGGRDRSHHSEVLRQLEHKGLVESRQRSGQERAPRRRGSRYYRLTEAGVTYIREAGEGVCAQ